MYKFLIILLLVSCSGKDRSKQIKQYEKRISIKKIPLLSSLHKKTIPIAIKHTKNACFFGDLDIMKRDTKINKNNRFIMTIEKIGSKPKVAFSSPFSVKKPSDTLLQGSFGSKFLDNDGIYGLYICSDKSNTGSCSKKKIMNINEVSWKLFRESEDKKKVKRDKIFFFKPVLIDKNHLYTLSPVAKNKESFTNLFTTVFKVSKKYANKVYKIMAKYDKLLSNIDPTISGGNALQIDLPTLADRCDYKFIYKMYQNQK